MPKKLGYHLELSPNQQLSEQLCVVPEVWDGSLLSCLEGRLRIVKALSPEDWSYKYSRH